MRNFFGKAQDELIVSCAFLLCDFNGSGVEYAAVSRIGVSFVVINMGLVHAKAIFARFLE